MDIRLLLLLHLIYSNIMITSINSLIDAISNKPTSILCVSGGTAIRMYLKYEDNAFHIYNKIDEVWDTYTLSEFISKNKLLIKCMEKGTLMRE